MIAVEVTSKKTGESWRFSEKQFARWKRDIGSNAAFLWEGGEGGDGVTLIDTTRMLKRKLGNGKHKGVLVVQTEAPYAGGDIEAWQLA